MRIVYIYIHNINNYLILIKDNRISEILLYILRKLKQ